MQNLHLKLTSKYPRYHSWHHTKHHNKIHWGVLVVFTLLIFGTISRWTPISFAADTIAPSTPTKLTATSVSSSQINLSWIASSDDVGVTGYKIYRCAGSACAPTTQIVTSAANSYSDTGLTASTAYTYAVSAYDAAGNESAKSSSVSVATVSAGFAATYYVSPTGTTVVWPQCANIDTPCSAQTAMANAVAGDTVYFRGGTYDVGWGVNSYPALYSVHSGTVDKPITFMAYPGETPVINAHLQVKITGIAGPGSDNTHLVDDNVNFTQAGIATWDIVRTTNKEGGAPVASGGVSDHIISFEGQGVHNTINLSPGDPYEIGKDMSNALGNGYQNYIVFDGFVIQANDGNEMAGLKIQGLDESRMVTGNVVKNCVLNGGNRKIVHGDNRDGLRIDNSIGTLVQNCRIYNYNQMNNWANTAAVKMYHNRNVIIENSEIYNCSSGIFDKGWGDGNIYRYNYVHGCARDLYITSYGWPDSRQPTGYYTSNHPNGRVYHNVFADGGISDETQDGSHSSNLTVYNNTMRIGGTMGNGTGKAFYNNIIFGAKPNNDIGLLRFSANDNLTAVPQTPMEIATADHNQFGGLPNNFLVRIHHKLQSYWTNYTSLAAWQASTELADGGHPGQGDLNSDPKFVNSSGNMNRLLDFILQSDSPSKGAGRDGVDMGADVSKVGIGGTQPPPDTQAPTTPTNPTSTAISSTQINLSWTASTDDTGVTGYKIFRCAGSACAPTVQIATSAVNSYSNTGLTASTAYTYTISAYDAAGNESGQSASVSIITQTKSSDILFQDDFEGAPLNNSNLGQWNYIGTLQSTSPDGEGFNGGHALKTDYQYIGREGFPEFTAIAKFANPIGNPIYIRWYQKWSDNWVWPLIQQKFLKLNTNDVFGIVDGRNSLSFLFNDSNVNKYAYINPSWNGYFPSRRDDLDSINHPDALNTCFAYKDPCGAVKFKTGKWYSIEVAIYKDSQNGWAKYWIDGMLSFSAEKLNTTNPPDNITLAEFQHIYQPRDQQHPEMYTWMDNVEVSTQYIGPIGTPDTQAPTAPTNLTALAISSSQINLSWTASTDDTGVTGYKIYRCAGSTCTPTTQIGTSATNSYSDTGLAASTTYTYTVSAYDAANNESIKSSSVSAATLASFKPSDLNKDGKVDSLDFEIFKLDFNRTDKPVSDFNQDGVVDSRDLGMLMGEWTR